MGYFSFGSPVSASDVSKPIFEIKDTEYKTNISAPMLSGSVKNSACFGSLAARSSPKISGGGFSELMVMLPHQLRARQAKIPS